MRNDRPRFGGACCFLERLAASRERVTGPATRYSVSARYGASVEARSAL